MNLVNIVDWDSNLSYGEVLYQYMNLEGICFQWDVGSIDSFWARHLVVCYQPDPLLDGDGDEHENCGISVNCLAPYPYSPLSLSPLPNMGNVFGCTVRNELYYNTALSVVYAESIRDQITDETSVKFWQIVAHELGHQTLDQNGETPASGAAHAEGGLMSGEPEGNMLQDIPGMRHFTAPTLVRFREAKRW